MDYAKFLVDDSFLVDHVIYRFKNKLNGKVYIGQTISDVLLILYGSNRNGNIKRDILNNNKKGKLGFTKNGSIWSLTSPTERRAYLRA